MVLCGLLVSVSACEDPDAVAEGRNKEIVTAIIEEAWNSGNLAILEEAFAAEFVYRDPAVPDATDLDSYKGFVSAVLGRWPERSLTIDDMIVEQNKVVVRYSFLGVQREGEGEPGTEVTVSHPGVQIYRFSGGKVVELDDIWVVPADDEGGQESPLDQSG
jgi:predicted SnoaL-like aldol condensation-catalyzing enzyme